jgi:CubicO group peptidase (beta-lactamase class C family)
MRYLPAVARLLLLLGCSWIGAHAALAADLLEQRFRSQADETLGGLVRDGRSSYAAAVLVADGREAASLSYGDERRVPKIPFSIESTEVDMNSLRKLYVAVAIAQLVDSGAIAGIDDPVNRYLKHYQLPPAFGHPVTIRELATHSAGLDETGFGSERLEADPPAFFAERFPGYFRNPDHFSSYDSYGPKLLTYMVSEITGKPFPQYVHDSILEPLGMHDTHLVDDGALAHRVHGYQPKVPSHEQVIEPLRPARTALLDGESVSTLRDMKTLLLALLGSAQQQVISPRMRELLFTIQQSNGPGGSAHGLVFDVVRSRGRTLFVHGGIGAAVLCWIALDVQRDAGMFYCYASVKARLDHDATHVPPPFPQIVGPMLEVFTACDDTAAGCPRFPSPRWQDAWAAYPGLYLDFGRHRSGFSRLRSLAHPVFVRVTRSGDSLALDGTGGFVETAPGVFANPSQVETFSIVRDSATGSLVLSISDRASAFNRVDWSNDPRLLTRLLALLILLAGSGGLLVILPRYGIDLGVRAAVAAHGAVVGAGVVVMYGFSAFGEPYFHGVAWPLHTMRVCAFLSIPACAFLLYTASRVRRMQLTGAARLGRLHLDLVCLSSLALVATLLDIGLIGFLPIH